MSDYEEPLDEHPPSIDPYEVLDLERTCSADDIKKAYRKAALRHHPDKVPDDPEKKKKAHETFQEIAFAYAVLSDPTRRKRYDETGSTSESIVDADGFDWSDYYRTQYKDAVNTDAIEQFAKKYKGSDDERDDLLAAFELFEGNMDQVYETVILSDPIDDDERFRKIIDDAIASREVPAFRPYLRESKKTAAARVKKAKAEAEEAESYAKELGVHDKLFGGKKEKGGRKPSKKESPEDGLAALIQKRQQDRSDSFLDHIAEKYGGSTKDKKKGKKRTLPDEPPEEAFAATAARKKTAKEVPQTPPRQTGSRGRK